MEITRRAEPGQHEELLQVLGAGQRGFYETHLKIRHGMGFYEPLVICLFNMQ